jgi:competence protein ComEA
MKPLLVILSIVIPALAQDLPDGVGKAETMKVCSQCHELARAISLRQDNAGWQTTVQKMVSLGAKGTPEEFTRVTEYLTANFPADTLPKIHINSARAIELESGLSLKHSEAMALIAYRTKHGGFQSFEELKSVPGLDFDRIAAKKDRVTFN